jgi:hypothetical protein
MWQLWREGMHFYTHAIFCPTCRKVMKYQNLREKKKKNAKLLLNTTKKTPTPTSSTKGK